MLEAFQGSIGKAIQLQDKQEEYEQIENVIVNLEAIQSLYFRLILSNIFFKCS